MKEKNLNKFENFYKRKASSLKVFIKLQLSLFL